MRLGLRGSHNEEGRTRETGKITNRPRKGWCCGGVEVRREKEKMTEVRIRNAGNNQRANKIIWRSNRVEKEGRTWSEIHPWIGTVGLANYTT